MLEIHPTIVSPSTGCTPYLTQAIAQPRLLIEMRSSAMDTALHRLLGEPIDGPDIRRGFILGRGAVFRPAASAAAAARSSRSRVVADPTTVPAGRRSPTPGRMQPPRS